MKSILFGIVCFREKYWETESFVDLVNSYKSSKRDDDKLHIYIYDNTDFNEWDNKFSGVIEKSILVNYHHSANNPGFAAAVNHFAKFAKENNFEWMVFLDQDTNLPIDFYNKYFLKSISENCEKIAFPKIFSNHKLISPSKYNYYRTQNLVLANKEKIELANVTAINSGLMLNTNFFYEEGGYNEQLRIDFCDHEFIERINNKNIFAEIIDISLKQNFSAETDNREKALRRYRLYINDMKIYRENKNKLIFFFSVDLPHLLKESYKHKSVGFLKTRLGLK